MAQIIVSSRYLKNGKRAKTKRKNYTKYIATRESVEKRPQNSGKTTANQKQLIAELIKEFPTAKQYLEFADYTKKPTAENASELISTIIERHADVIGNRRNFVGYMAKRPGAERRGEHGLFNDSDAPIDLNAVANEVAEHPGYVWTHVVSLRREDAVRLGYTNSDMWRELVKRHIDNISKAQNIPLSNLKWYAAFHDTTHHPHIHLIVYSKDPRQGYLTKDGMAAIRSAFANDIFHEDMKSIYQEQTLTRDELKALSEDQMSEIVSQLGSSQVDERLLVKVRELYSQLQRVNGKKVYGYLPKDVKQTVDDIFLLLSLDENIQKMYDKWCEFEKAKYRMYTQKDKEFSSLVENKEFRSVKNMIIREVLKADIIPNENYVFDEIESVEELVMHTTNQLSNEIIQKRKETQKSLNSAVESDGVNKGIELLTDLVNKGDDIFAYRLAKLFLSNENYNLPKAVLILEKLCSNSRVQTNAAYQLANILLGNNGYHDTARAVQLLEFIAEKNMWAAYRLGCLYMFGMKDLKPDYTKAIIWLTKSADSGNKYAEKLINYSNGDFTTAISNTVINLLLNLGRFIEENNTRCRRNVAANVDKKLKRVLQKKKRELGIKSSNIDVQFNE